MTVSEANRCPYLDSSCRACRRGRAEERRQLVADERVVVRAVEQILDIHVEVKTVARVRAFHHDHLRPVAATGTTAADTLRHRAARWWRGRRRQRHIRWALANAAEADR